MKKTTTNSKARTKELTRKLDDLANEIVTDPKRLAEFVKAWSAGFHRYSMGNTLLAQWQHDGATLLAGFNSWKKDHKRHVLKGSKAIKILAPTSFKKETGEMNDNDEPITETIPYFITVSVFDVSQTDGEPIDLGCSDLIGKGAVKFDDMAKLATVPVEMQGASTANGWTNGSKIVISDQGHESSRVATLFHEMAHVELGHTGIAAHIDGQPRDIKEMEAEAVSFLVCSAVGIENKQAALYLGNWNADGDKLNKSGTRILKTAEKIIKRIEEAA